MLLAKSVLTPLKLILSGPDVRGGAHCFPNVQCTGCAQGVLFRGMHTHVHMHVHLCTPIPAHVHLCILIDTYACMCVNRHTLKAHTHLDEPLGILST